jgi:hypothetical protein
VALGGGPRAHVARRGGKETPCNTM